MSESPAGMPRTWGRVPTAPTQFRQSTRLFWVLTVLLAAGAVGFVIALTRLVVLSGQAVPVLVSVLIWVVWTLVLFGLICLVDVYRHVPPSIRFALALWGAGVGTLTSMVAEQALDPVIDPVFGQVADALSTGLIEEGTKLLGVILVAALVPALFRRPMGGLICGMMVGLGFSFLENIEYAVQAVMAGGAGSDPYTNITTAVVQRGFTQGAGLHLVLTGLTSLGVAYFVAHRRSSRGPRWAGALAFILGAIVFHFLWDLFVSGRQGAFAGAVVMTLNILHFVLVALMIVYAVRAERRWLVNATLDTGPVVEPDERRSLRKHRTRRQAQARVADAHARRRLKTRQWAQIGWANAFTDGAPETETARLAEHVAALRQQTSGTAGPRDVPTQRRSASSEHQNPAGSSN